MEMWAESNGGGGFFLFILAGAQRQRVERLHQQRVGAPQAAGPVAGQPHRRRPPRPRRHHGLAHPQTLAAHLNADIHGNPPTHSPTHPLPPHTPHPAPTLNSHTRTDPTHSHTHTHSQTRPIKKNTGVEIATSTGNPIRYERGNVGVVSSRRRFNFFLNKFRFPGPC